MFSKDFKFVRLSNAVAAGQTAIEPTAVAMDGYDGVVFFIPFGAITTGAVTAVKAQSCTAADGTGASDLAGTAMTIADDQDNKVAVLEIVRPLAEHTFVRPYITRGTQNAVVDGVFALLYNGRVKPAVVDATVMAVSKVVGSPANGTA